MARVQVAKASEPVEVASLPAILARELCRIGREEGAPTNLLEELIANGFDRSELFDIVIPRRTLARRLQAGHRLSAAETDRALRLARIGAHAERVFGDPAKAHGWLRKPNRALRGAMPLQLLKTETGAQLVEQTLYQIDYGIVA